MLAVMFLNFYDLSHKWNNCTTEEIVVADNVFIRFLQVLYKVFMRFVQCCYNVVAKLL